MKLNNNAFQKLSARTCFIFTPGTRNPDEFLKCLFHLSLIVFIPRNCDYLLGRADNFFVVLFLLRWQSIARCTLELGFLFLNISFQRGKTWPWKERYNVFHDKSRKAVLDVGDLCKHVDWHGEFPVARFEMNFGDLCQVHGLAWWDLTGQTWDGVYVKKSNDANW